MTSLDIKCSFNEEDDNSYCMPFPTNQHSDGNSICLSANRSSSERYTHYTGDTGEERNTANLILMVLPPKHCFQAIYIQQEKL